MKEKISSLRRRTLRFSQIEGSFWSLMMGCFETFVLFYIVKRGVSKHELAILSSVPILLGSLANWLIPLFTPNRYLKTALLATVSIQIVGILGMLQSISIPHPYFILFFALSFYWMGGMSSSPLWTDWISGWLPLGRLGRYLGRRNSYNAFLIVITYLSLAFFLFQSQSAEVFFFPFILGAIFRTSSLVMLAMQASPSQRRSLPSKPQSISHEKFSTAVLYVIIFTTLFRLVSNIATPFLVSYMVDELRFDLLQYAWIIATPFIGRSLMFSRWGETMRTHSPLIVLQICMLLSSFVCAAWTRFTSPWTLTLAETTSGMAWGGFELACVLMMQSFRPGRARALIGFHLALTNAAAIGGALIGAHLYSLGFSSQDVLHTSAVLRFSIVLLFFAMSFKLSSPRLHLKQIQECIVTLSRQWRIIP